MGRKPKNQDSAKVFNSAKTTPRKLFNDCHKALDLIDMIKNLGEECVRWFSTDWKTYSELLSLSRNQVENKSLEDILSNRVRSALAHQDLMLVLLRINHFLESSDADTIRGKISSLYYHFDFESCRKSAVKVARNGRKDFYDELCNYYQELMANFSKWVIEQGKQNSNIVNISHYKPQPDLERVGKIFAKISFCDIAKVNKENTPVGQISQTYIGEYGIENTITVILDFLEDF